MHSTSFHGIGFSPSVEMIALYGSRSPHNILTAVSDGSHMEMFGKHVVEMILKGLNLWARFMVKCKSVSSNTRTRPPKALGKNWRSNTASASPSSGRHSPDPLNSETDGSKSWEKKHESPFRQPCRHTFTIVKNTTNSLHRADKQSAVSVWVLLYWEADRDMY